MKRWLLIVLFLSSPGFGNPLSYRKSLLQNGYNASPFGDLSLQKDSIMNLTFTSARAQGGWLLTHGSYLSTTIGASYTGIGAQTQDDASKTVELGYYGPVVEAIVLPEQTWKFVLSYSYETGFVKRSEVTSREDFFYSSLQMKELRGALAFTLGKHEQILVGMAEQNQRLNHFYKQSEDETLFRRRGRSGDISRSYFISFRLAAY